MVGGATPIIMSAPVSLRVKERHKETRDGHRTQSLTIPHFDQTDFDKTEIVKKELDQAEFDKTEVDWTDFDLKEFDKTGFGKS